MAGDELRKKGGEALPHGKNCRKLTKIDSGDDVTSAKNIAREEEVACGVGVGMNLSETCRSSGLIGATAPPSDPPNGKSSVVLSDKAAKDVKSSNSITAARSLKRRALDSNLGTLDDEIAAEKLSASGQRKLATRQRTVAELAQATAKIVQEDILKWEDLGTIKYQASPSVMEAVGRAESAARRWLQEHPQEREESPDANDVLTTLREIGTEWPTQARPNVTDTGKPVPGMCMGLVFALGQGAQCSHVSEAHPALTRLLTRWCTATLPRTKAGRLFPFSSLQVNYNYRATKHVDANNIGPSYIMSIGSHTGGALWTSDQGIIDCKNKWRLFDGNREHETQSFEPVPSSDGKSAGERISFIAFAHGQYSKLTKPVVKQLRALGFTAARSDGQDDEFFERYRIEKSYLTDEHNKAFRACLAARNESNDPRTGLNAIGDVAIECFGRQAERGGGWMAFKAEPDKPATVLELKENSVGIWCAELEWADRGEKLKLKKHDRLNFYANLNSATRELQRRVKAMNHGTPVILGIADTAAAASRPLTKAVYTALQQLGAPSDMPAIEYRAAWALIGFKGAAPGDALTAMGTRSTLLRLDATFSLDAQGNTKLMKHVQPDLTSIIDVVTGGGQDEPVYEDNDVRN